MPATGLMTQMIPAITLTPGHVTLADWRTVTAGAAVRLDAAAIPAIEASAQAVDAIIARGKPVYGINTGLGKLANVHIAPNALAALQRNMVLSHAARGRSADATGDRAAHDGFEACEFRPRLLRGAVANL